MQTRISSRLGPVAKKLVLTASVDQRVPALITLSSATRRQSFQQSVEHLQGTIIAWMPETKTASIEVPVGYLTKLADLMSVIFVEVSQLYRP